MNDGYYVGKSNKSLINKNLVLISVKDSTATLEAFIEEKGMIIAFNIFNDQKILPRLDTFKIIKANQQYIISNDSNKLNITQNNGNFLIEKPKHMKLKYYKELPIAKIPNRKYALYCYAWFFPHIILGIEDTISAECKVYLQNNLDLNIKSFNNKISYEEYYKILKDSLIRFKYNFDEIQNK
jgi:hypothetical protein